MNASLFPIGPIQFDNRNILPDNDTDLLHLQCLLMRSRSTGVRTDMNRMSSCLYTALTLAVVGACGLATVRSAHLAAQTDHKDQETVEACSSEMFGNSSAALRACRAQFSLQRNWYPDPIQGLFSYQTWNGMDGFWQNGVVLETMANCLHYLNNTRYRGSIQLNLSRLFNRIFNRVFSTTVQGVPHYYKNSVENSVEIQLN